MAVAIIESLAILDYLEAKYPTAMLPTDAKDLATVRMVQMLTVNELTPAMNPLINQMMEFALVNDSQKLAQTNQKIATVLKFFEDLLSDKEYFGGENLGLGDIVAGCSVTLLPILGFALIDYPKIGNWCHRIMQRPAWQHTQPTLEAIEAFKQQMKALMQQS